MVCDSSCPNNVSETGLCIYNLKQTKGTFHYLNLRQLTKLGICSLDVVQQLTEGLLESFRLPTSYDTFFFNKLQMINNNK
jgi:hypothetical protein